MSYQIPRWSRIAGNISLLLAGTVLARLFTALTLILIARQTGPAQFGQYTACFTLTWLTSPIFSLGLDMWLLGNGRRSGDDAELADNVAACLALKVGLGLLWLGLIVAIAPLLNSAIFPPTLLRMAALTVWLDELVRLVLAGFQAGERNRTVVSLLIFSQALILLPVVGLSFGQVTQVMNYASTQLVATGIGSALSVGWLVRTFGFSVVAATVRRIAHATAPYGVSMFLSLVYGRADVMIIAYWLGATAAGFYSPAISILSALVLLPLAVHNIVLPIFSQAESRNPSGLPRLVYHILLISGLLGAGMGCALFFSARWLINLLYGESYQATGVVLMILGGVLIARCINLSAAAALIALHLQRKRVLPQAIAATFNVVVNIAIVGRWGINGVAIVFVLTEGWLILAYLWLVWRAIQTYPQTRAMGVR